MVNKRVGSGVRRRRLKFGEEGSWYVRECGKLKNRDKAGPVSKKGWGQGVQGKGLRGKLTQR